jgi:chromosome segregation ATPase
MQELLTEEAIAQRIKELLKKRDAIEKDVHHANLKRNNNRLNELNSDLAKLDAELDHLLRVSNVLKEMACLPEGDALPSVEKQIRALQHAEKVLLNTTS